ncbi:hypothetical protein BHE74_00024427 [Ensete ventricosum]|nr:hypothetical protein BHE74_00024427 [Ensete ventricosum]RZS16358.1 hypothetical protein BHM03_00048345 [Ensete ventricosum]
MFQVNLCIGKQWKEKQIRKITDRAFDHIRDESSDSRDGLTFEDVYIAVLCVFNDINKHLPGPHHDPPTKDKLRSLMKVRNSPSPFILVYFSDVRRHRVSFPLFFDAKDPQFTRCYHREILKRVYTSIHVYSHTIEGIKVENYAIISLL